MADRIRKFVPRAFRYVLRPQDKHLMRFSLENTSGSAHIEKTILINMSESGVAFLIDNKTDVHMNERLKVEIPIPGGEQIAWWGRVVRIQEYEPRAWFFGSDPFKEEPKIMVGVKFDELPEGHSRTIRKGIEQSFMQAMRDQHYRNWLYYRNVARNFTKLLVIAALLAGLVGFLWYFTRPSENYDANKGAPWGQRFKF